jgi:hypothetical protein
VRRAAAWSCHGSPDVLIPLTPWLAVFRGALYGLTALGLGLAAAACLVGAVWPMAWLTQLFVGGALLAFVGVVGRVMVAAVQPAAVPPPRRS